MKFLLDEITLNMIKAIFAFAYIAITVPLEEFHQLFELWGFSYSILWLSLKSCWYYWDEPMNFNEKYICVIWSAVENTLEPKLVSAISLSAKTKLSPIFSIWRRLSIFWWSPQELHLATQIYIREGGAVKSMKRIYDVTESHRERRL